MKICLVMLYQMVVEQNLKRTRQTNFTVDAPTVHQEIQLHWDKLQSIRWVYGTVERRQRIVNVWSTIYIYV